MCCLPDAVVLIPEILRPRRTEHYELVGWCRRRRGINQSLAGDLRILYDLTRRPLMDRARFLLSALFVFSSVALAQISPTVAALGDSIGEGVQSADATTRTQPYQFSNLIAQQFGLPFTQPLIDGGVLTNIFSTQGRTRVDPSLVANNVAVSGATIHDLLNATYVPPTDTETDL